MQNKLSRRDFLRAIPPTFLTLLQGCEQPKSYEAISNEDDLEKLNELRLGKKQIIDGVVKRYGNETDMGKAGERIKLELLGNINQDTHPAASLPDLRRLNSKTKSTDSYKQAVSGLKEKLLKYKDESHGFIELYFQEINNYALAREKKKQKVDKLKEYTKQIHDEYLKIKKEKKIGQKNPPYIDAIELNDALTKHFESLIKLEPNSLIYGEAEVIEFLMNKCIKGLLGELIDVDRALE